MTTEKNIYPGIVEGTQKYYELKQMDMMVSLVFANSSLYILILDIYIKKINGDKRVPIKNNEELNTMAK